MSKSKNPESKPEKKKTKAREILNKVALAGVARLKRMAGSTKVWLFLITTIAIVCSLIAKHPEGLSLGLLYLMPDGEAKSGRTGSVVYMRNGRRRNFVVPALVQNAYTSGVRSSFSSLSSAFKSLTPEQISAWNAAGGFFRSDRFGRSKEVKGKALFVMLNQNLFSAGRPTIDDVPLPGAVAGLDEIVINDGVDPVDCEISWTTGSTDADTAHLVFATANLSPGISKPGNSEFRQIDVIVAGTASPFAFGTAYVTKFGTQTAGSKMFIKLVPVNRWTGQSGGAIVGSAITAP
jgi:hypothetical protein